MIDPEPKPVWPLAGLRVIDLSDDIAGPYATKLFVDAGARVIKVDLDDAVLAERRAEMEARGAKAWKPFGRKRDVSPALRAYAAMTTSAARGAVRVVPE